MSRPFRAKPRDLAPNWPDGPTTERTAEVARLFALKIQEAMNGRSARATATAAGISHVTLLRILDGSVWPDLETIAKLEINLDVDAWPGRHV